MAVPLPQTPPTGTRRGPHTLRACCEKNRTEQNCTGYTIREQNVRSSHKNKWRCPRTFRLFSTFTIRGVWVFEHAHSKSATQFKKSINLKNTWCCLRLFDRTFENLGHFYLVLVIQKPKLVRRHAVKATKRFALNLFETALCGPGRVGGRQKLSWTKSRGTFFSIFDHLTFDM